MRVHLIYSKDLEDTRYNLVLVVSLFQSKSLERCNKNEELRFLVARLDLRR